MIKRHLALLLILSTTILVAQRNSSSPYSYFGVGEEFKTKTVEQASMGGIGSAYSSNRYLNFINPAANADLRFTTYGLGLTNNSLSISDGRDKQSSTSTRLSYIALGFPLGKKAGFVVGLQPLSSIGYSLTNSIKDADANTIDITKYSGEGGVNRIYGSLGVKVFKGISLGLEADYSFGNSNNGILNVRQGVSLGTRYNEISTIKGGAIKLGVQYKATLDKNNTILTLGWATKLQSVLKSSGRENIYSIGFSDRGEEILKDTLFSAATSGKYIAPAQTTLGVGLGKENKWYVGVDYEFQGAVKTEGFLATAGKTFKYDKSSRFSLGGFYLPKVNSISSYFERVTYRAGMRFENTGLLVDGTGNGNNFSAIKDFGINLGLGLPLGNRLSNLNVGLEYGQKGTLDNNLIKENYFNLRLSLSLNDTWFRQRKID